MKSLVYITLVLLPLIGFTQEKRMVLVEHFTNTPCPICANNNPKVYSVIDRNADKVHHISIHTNSPYPNCVLHNFNPEDNGARQSFYGANSTPRVYVNGKLSSASQESVFEKDLEEALTIEQPLQMSLDEQGDMTTRTVKINITSKVPIEASNHRIFVALVEKLVNYDAPNGETEHRDVLRDFVTSGDGDPINLPLQGETVNLEYIINIPAGVAPSEAYVMAYIQDLDTRDVLGSAIHSENTTGTDEKAVEVGLVAFPNPVKSTLQVSVSEDQSILGYEVLSLSGARLLHSEWVKPRSQIEISVEQLVPGSYILKTLVGEHFASVNFVKK